MDELSNIIHSVLRDKTTWFDMTKHGLSAVVATAGFSGAIHYGRQLYEQLTGAAQQTNLLQQAIGAAACTMTLSAALETNDYFNWRHTTGGFETTDLIGDAIGAAAFVIGTYLMTRPTNEQKIAQKTLEGATTNYQKETQTE